ncbi:hypothetical protein HN51_016722 [Arachis hypogaea]
MGRSCSSISLFLALKLLLLVVAWSSKRGHCLTTPRPRATNKSIGAVLDLDSLMGKQQKIAMEIAIRDFNRFSRTKLHLEDPNIAMDLAQKKQLLAIVGTITQSEASLATEINNATKNTPILSLSSFAPITELPSSPFPQLIQLGDDINIQMQCLAAIVGHFKWKKVTTIYEVNSRFSYDPGVLISLSNSLRHVGSEIVNQLAFPSLSLQSRIENELNQLKKKSNRVFLIVHSSLELASVLCKKAKQMGLMEKGYVWIIPNEVASLLDSVNSSVISTMQGVIGFKTHFLETTKPYRKFGFRFRRRFAQEYPEEEENNTPSVFALRAYDAAIAIAKVTNKSQGKFNMKEFLDENLHQSSTFTIINVIGKSYREMAVWSPTHGFSKNFVEHEKMEVNKSNGYGGVVLSNIYWPGDLHSVPRGWTNSNEEMPLKIGVPANDAFAQFVNVTYGDSKHATSITGFSINVFKAAIKNLPYHLHYDFVPFNGSYDEMVNQVNNKTLDAAVGDISILAYRYHLVEFSQPYIDSGLNMVVVEKPNKSKQTWMFMDAFTKEMWLMMAAMHVLVGFVIWLIEREENEELQGLGAMLWFLVTVIFLAHREPIRRPLARTVLAPWLFVILIVTSSFTASLTSMMTVSQLEPSVVDIQTLQKRNAAVGCDENSFIVRYLIDILKFKPENIRRINSINGYPAAFKNNEIEAAFFVAPHAKVFLAKYSCEGFVQAGSTFRLGGFGFVFQRGSSLARDISEALLSVIENGETEQLEKDMLSNSHCSLSDKKAKESSPLGYQPFLGLFCICGSIAILALLYIMLCLTLKNVENLVKYMRGALIQLWRIRRWITTHCVGIYSKVQSRSMRGVNVAIEARNSAEIVIDSEQVPRVAEVV